jgi:uncharacterized SAM-binding protein YcdF (DUF218 family)
MMMKNRPKNILFLRILRKIIFVAGIFYLVCIILAFTKQPYWGYHWLGTSKSELNREPVAIILLGGGGMPSESNLMRSWYTAYAAKSFPEAKIIVAMPGDISDSLSTPFKMKNELVVRGIDSDLIFYENIGTNTRAQALECKKLIGADIAVLLVTSPDHARRSVLCFLKVGFAKVNALPAFENAVESDLSFEDDSLGGNKTLIPDVGKSISVRYQVWNHLKYEILVAREMMAMSYYWLRGWI